MRKVRSYISRLMLVLLLFPIVEKTKHDLKHFNDEHCGVSDTHYCQAEHSCSVCDYVFFSALKPPKVKEIITLFSGISNGPSPLIVLQSATSLKFVLSLRGPPATIHP